MIKIELYNSILNYTRNAKRFPLWFKKISSDFIIKELLNDICSNGTIGNCATFLLKHLDLNIVKKQIENVYSLNYFVDSQLIFKGKYLEDSDLKNMGKARWFNQLNSLLLIEQPKLTAEGIIWTKKGINNQLN